MLKPNLVFMFGEDLFALQEESARWQRGFLEKHGDLNLESLDAEEVKLEQIQASIPAAPFLGEKRLIILKNFLSSKNAEDQKKLLPTLESLPDSTICVLFEHGKPDARTSVFKWLSKNATLKEFPLLEGYKLLGSIESRIQKRGSSIERSALELLASKFGKDPLALDQEIEKLSLLAKENPINRSMVDTLSSDPTEESIFKLTDELSRRNVKAALYTLNQLEWQGEEGAYLFAMILRQIRLLLEIRSLLDQGKSEAEIASQIKAHPYVVKLNAQQCKRFKSQELRNFLEELLTLDRRLKTGQIHYQKREEDQFLLVLERMILGLSPA